MSDNDEYGAYQALAEESDDHRWAFGTGFTDPLEGVDTRLPPGADGAALAAYCLMLGDDALIYSHRLQQWVTRMPELEEETAVANIALDLLGQARMLLARAGGILGRTEDQLAFCREEKEFRNVRLAEHADRDFGPVDWDEFKAVVGGNGPCNAQRIARRRAAHEDGAWVREAAAAHAAKAASRENAKAASREAAS